MLCYYHKLWCLVKDMAAGEVITPECIRSIRPGYGLPPKYYDILLGKQVNRAIERGTAVSWEYIG
ncbi:MAG TPA: hypothetical protein IGP91_04300 [Thermosynechococcus sp. M46_R2017_013]|nr:hypothetical protein [Thermosynechococcus sp. M46_R2017_013]